MDLPYKVSDALDKLYNPLCFTKKKNLYKLFYFNVISNIKSAFLIKKTNNFLFNYLYTENLVSYILEWSKKSEYVHLTVLTIQNELIKNPQIVWLSF